MCTDLTIPSMLGYFMTMLYNPNNATLETSPFTTVAEQRAGKQLCDLFGYNTDEQNKDSPLAWGHITADGSIANLESIWVENCKGDRKLFKDMSTWELLNLRPETILELPEALKQQFNISNLFLEETLKEYSVQAAGKDALEKYHKIDKPVQYMISKTHHYSWPKGAAITGLGSKNMAEIDVDLDACIDMTLLKNKLHECANRGQAIYAVVVIVGSTEEGAVERLSEILKLRQKFQQEYGLSFLVHADAAWGGYFATMLERDMIRGTNEKLVQKPVREGVCLPGRGFTPSLCLKKDTEQNLLALKYADSITVDPHKTGYIPYPAGSLVYRDGRMRYLVTWSSPVLAEGPSENMAIYGVESSKPGAAAMATWLSNQTIGLNPCGYGMLLGEAAFTSARLSAYWATIETEDFICVPFNRLGPERKGHSFRSKKVEEEKQWFRENILEKENKDITAEAMDKLRELGSDLNINAFALNWKYEGNISQKEQPQEGQLNRDVEEANYLMKKVVEKFSVTSVETNTNDIPLFLTSTKFEPELYGECAQVFMDRLGLDRSQQDLVVLRNVVMSPFPTKKDFIGELMRAFEKVVKEEVKGCRDRNKRGDRRIQFLMQGTDVVFLVLQASFHLSPLRQQLILAAELKSNLQQHYTELKRRYPRDTIMLESLNEVDLEDKIGNLAHGETQDIQGRIYRKGHVDDGSQGIVRLTRIIKSRPLNPSNRDLTYPQHYMPFYLYGTPQQKHISHILLRAPNIALSASNVAFSPELDQIIGPQLPDGLILALSSIPEVSIQPYTTKNQDLPAYFFFQSGKQYKVTVWRDPRSPVAEGPGLLEGLKDPVGSGTMTLGNSVDVDAEEINHNPADCLGIDPTPWQDFDRIEDALNGAYDRP
ncbi:hypothetical protein BBP40_003333 [Aspergillus hancockii]|nr:hypothetical protein BBP40_003333 [Aspergillus hancockii]